MKKDKKIYIGKILQETRRSLGYTQEHVSEQIGLAPRYLSDIERDKTKGSLDTLVKLCNMYRVSPSHILKDYINTFDINDSPSGYSNLSRADKEIVKQLVQFMNRKGNKRKKNNNSKDNNGGLN